MLSTTKNPSNSPSNMYCTFAAAPSNHPSTAAASASGRVSHYPTNGGSTMPAVAATILVGGSTNSSLLNGNNTGGGGGGGGGGSIISKRSGGMSRFRRKQQPKQRPKAPTTWQTPDGHIVIMIGDPPMCSNQLGGNSGSITGGGTESILSGSNSRASTIRIPLSELQSRLSTISAASGITIDYEEIEKRIAEAMSRLSDVEDVNNNNNPAAHDPRPNEVTGGGGYKTLIRVSSEPDLTEIGRLVDERNGGGESLLSIIEHSSDDDDQTIPIMATPATSIITTPMPSSVDEPVSSANNNAQSPQNNRRRRRRNSEPSSISTSSGWGRGHHRQQQQPTRIVLMDPDGRRRIIAAAPPTPPSLGLGLGPRRPRLRPGGGRLLGPHHPPPPPPGAFPPLLSGLPIWLPPPHPPPGPLSSSSVNNNNNNNANNGGVEMTGWRRVSSPSSASDRQHLIVQSDRQNCGRHRSSAGRNSGRENIIAAEDLPHLFPGGVTPGQNWPHPGGPGFVDYDQMEGERSAGKSCMSQSTLIRLFIGLISLIGITCVIVGVALGALTATGTTRLTLCLLMIGVGVVLVSVSGIACRLTTLDPRLSSSSGTGSSGAWWTFLSPRRRRRDRVDSIFHQHHLQHQHQQTPRGHHPYFNLTGRHNQRPAFPEFPWQPPPPSYNATVRNTLFSMYIGPQPGPPPPPGTHPLPGPPNVCIPPPPMAAAHHPQQQMAAAAHHYPQMDAEGPPPGSPPPTYRPESRAVSGSRRAGLSGLIERPPSYRSAESLPTIDLVLPSNYTEAIHSNDDRIQLIENDEQTRTNRIPTGDEQNNYQQTLQTASHHRTSIPINSNQSAAAGGEGIESVIDCSTAVPIGLSMPDDQNEINRSLGKRAGHRATNQMMTSNPPDDDDEYGRHQAEEEEEEQIMNQSTDSSSYV